MSVLLTLVMAVGLLPTTALADMNMSAYTGKRITHIEMEASVDPTYATDYDADDNAYQVSRSIIEVGTETGNTRWGINFTPTSYTYTDTDGTTKHSSNKGLLKVSHNSIGIHWKDATGKWDWADNSMDHYLAGEYRYKTGVQVDETEAGGTNVYRIDPKATVTVNWKNSGGKSESCGVYAYNHDVSSYSYASITTPSFTVTGTGPLKLTTAGNIPSGYAEEEIKSFSVASWASGGQVPYTFSKVSGPAGINVSADGTVSGAPTTASAATTLTINVTDSNGAENTAEIPVGAIKAARKVIKTVELGGLYHPCVEDDPANNRAYFISIKDANGNEIPLDESPLCMPSLMCGWRVKDGKTWKQFDGNFAAGKEYRYGVQLRIDGEENCEKFAIAEDLTVTVQGLDSVAFEQEDSYSESTYACTYVYSTAMTPLTALNTLTGTISYVGAARLHEPLNARVNVAHTENYNVQWQYSEAGGTLWYKLGTGNSITLDKSWLKGRLIRAVAYSTDPNYSGTIYGAALTVERGWNMGIPTSPKVEYISTDKKLTITDDSYNAEQEYCWTNTPSKDLTTGSAVWPSSNVGTNRILAGVTPGTTYYVYTRFKETSTREAGRILGVAMYTVPNPDGDTSTDKPVKDVSYPNNPLGKRTIYLPVGESVNVAYTIDPVDATTNKPVWKSSYTEKLTVEQTDGNLKLTAGTGEGVASKTPVRLYPQKSESNLQPWYYYGSGTVSPDLDLYVYVYDKTKPETVRRLNVGGGTIDLYKGDTYDLNFAGLKAKDFLPAIEGADKTNYTLKAYIFTSTLTGGTLDVANDSIQIVDDEIKANAVGTGTVVRVYALAAGESEYNVAPIATYTVNVKERPAVLDFSVTPPVLTLQAGNTYQLTATKTPAAADDTFTWSSSDSAVTVDATTGEVTAVSAGKATITATFGAGTSSAMTATCTVTVLPACTTHSCIYQEKDWGHVEVCGLCGYTNDVVLPHDLCWYENAPTAGQMYGECVDCGYTTTPVDMTTTPTPTPTPGGSSSVSTYAITVKDAKNGDVTADRKSASSGTTVTVTVDPDKGYTLETLTVLDKNGKEVKLTDKGNGKYTFKMPASSVTVKAAFVKGGTSGFVDVPTDAYFADAVLWAAKEGITGGIDATHFAPYATCTRAQAVTFLRRAAGCPAPKSSEMPFTDVPSGSYCYDAVLWAVENGVTRGTTDTTFSPNAECSRAQIVTFLWRSQKSPAIDAANPFTDVSAEAYYANAVLWAVENGITNGNSATTFGPKEDCTRAQIVTFIYRCMK